jgi:Uma2 family endonuclease
LVALLVHKLLAYVLERSLGAVVGDRGEYHLDEGIALQPDVSFVANLFPPIPERVYAAPDLAIEILSPSNSVSKMKYRIRTFFQYGTRLFWLVDPEEQDVTVYQQSADGVIVSYRLTLQDTLTGGDVLPDFRLPVRELFPAAQTPAS